MELDPFRKTSKICGICGDKALGFNFNAVTCEACKAFFRRNALRTKDFKCPFDGNCKIDLVTRRFCQKCRLKKCFDIGMKKEWILSEDEKKNKRDKIVENRRKKDHVPGTPYGNLDSYSNSSIDESYSPEMKPSIKSHSDLLNPNYSLSVSEGKGFFNSLYLLEQYQNQYQTFMASGKTPKEPMVPYSSPIAKVPNHSADDLGGAKCDSILRSPPPMATTSNNSSLLNGYQGIYKGVEHTKHFDYGYGPFGNHHHQHHRLPMQPLHRPPTNGHPNSHMPAMPQDKPEAPPHPASSQYYKCTFNGAKTEAPAELNTRPVNEMSSNSNDSSYHFNTFYHEKNLAAGRSRSESQITSPDLVLNGKSPHNRLNGSTDSGYTKETNDSNGYLSSDDDNMPARAPYAAEYPKDLNDDSNSVSNCDVRPAIKKNDVEMESSSRSVPTVKPSLSVYNFIEELRMQELALACDLLRPWCRYNKVVHEMLQVNEMYEAVEVIINKVIEMARMVTTFKDLCEMEQMALLKGAVTEMIILRSVLNYMPDKDSWFFNLHEANDEGEFLKYSTYEKLICKGYYVEVKQFMLSFSQDWKSDKTLFDLLTVIILFTPNRPNLKHKEIIKLEHLTWRHLLQKHLDSKVGSKELSRNYFTNLMDLLERLHQINEKVNKMYTFKVIESFKL